MRPSEFEGKRVLIMGLGLHGSGIGAAMFFARLGGRVIVTDLKSRRELAPSIAKLRRFRNITYHLGGHRPADFKTAEFVIKGPGVPETSPFLAGARRAGVPVLSDVEIFFRLCPAPIIGVTGTKGKSTATQLLGEFLTADHSRRIWVGGNVRNSMLLKFLPDVKPADLVLLELSSFQLDSLKRQRRSPHIAVITNIFPDHLNRYPSMAAYTASKGVIFRFQKRGDALFIPAEDRLLSRMAKKAPARVIRVKTSNALRRLERSLPPAVPPYHRPNIALAVAVARHLGVGERAIRTVLARFRGIPGRMERVRVVAGIEFINDTTATNPGAAAAAVTATKRRIGNHWLHVIAGGSDKRLPAEELARSLARHARSIVWLPGKATDKMKSIIRSRKLAVRMFDARTMPEAVRLAFGQARRGDVILLSPGAASFGLFKHEFDRGEQFVTAVRSLRPPELDRSKIFPYL